MSDTATKWSRIREQYLHGEEGIRGNRKVEVIRVEFSDWECFCFIDGQPVNDLPGKGTYQQKKREAAEWLRPQEPT